MTTPRIAQAEALRAEGFSEEQIIAAAGEEAAALTRPAVVVPITAVVSSRQPQVDALAAEGRSRADIAEVVEGGLVPLPPETVETTFQIGTALGKPEPTLAPTAAETESTLSQVRAALASGTVVSAEVLRDLNVSENQIGQIGRQQTAIQALKRIPGVSVDGEFRLDIAIKGGATAEILRRAGFDNTQIFRAINATVPVITTPDIKRPAAERPGPSFNIAPAGSAESLAAGDRALRGAFTDDDQAITSQAEISARVARQRFDTAQQSLSRFLEFDQDGEQVIGVRIDEAIAANVRPQDLIALGVGQRSINAAFSRLAQTRLVQAAARLGPVQQPVRQPIIRQQDIVPPAVVRPAPPPGTTFDIPGDLEQERSESRRAQAMAMTAGGESGPTGTTLGIAINELAVVDAVNKVGTGELSAQEARLYIAAVRDLPLEPTFREAGYIIPGLGTFLSFQDAKESGFSPWSTGFFVTSAAVDVILVGIPVGRGAVPKIIAIPKAVARRVDLKGQRGGAITPERFKITDAEFEQIKTRGFEAPRSAGFAQARAAGFETPRAVTAPPPPRVVPVKPPPARPVRPGRTDPGPIRTEPSPRRVAPPERPGPGTRPTEPTTPATPTTPARPSRPRPLPGSPETTPLPIPTPEPVPIPEIPLEPGFTPGERPSRVEPTPEPIKEPQPGVEPSPGPSTTPGTRPGGLPGGPGSQPGFRPATAPVETPGPFDPFTIVSPGEQAQPSTRPETSPFTRPRTQPATEPITQPATEPETSPFTKPRTQPATEPRTQPATEPRTQPATEPKTSPLTEPRTAPATKPATSPRTEPQTRPVTEPGTAPATRPATLPQTAPSRAVGTGTETATTRARTPRLIPFTLPSGEPIPAGQFPSRVEWGQGENTISVDLLTGRQTWRDRDPDGRSPEDTFVVTKLTDRQPSPKSFSMGVFNVRVDRRGASFSQNALADGGGIKKASKRPGGLAKKRSRGGGL